MRSADERVFRFYSNVLAIALGWITVISFKESNSKAGKHVAGTGARVDTMVGMVLLVADVVGGGGGIYPQSRHAD